VGGGGVKFLQNSNRYQAPSIEEWSNCHFKKPADAQGLLLAK
jgi:hypothetical protein